MHIMPARRSPFLESSRDVLSNHAGYFILNTLIILNMLQVSL